MKITRRQLSRIIREEVHRVSEGLISTLFDTGPVEREVFKSDFDTAQQDAEENGKAYLQRRRRPPQAGLEVIEFDENGNATVTDLTAKDVFDANDGTVHYDERPRG